MIQQFENIVENEFEKHTILISSKKLTLQMPSFLFSLFIFVIIFYSSLKRREQFLRTRNVDPTNRVNYLISNVSYFIVNSLFALIVSTFSYYFPKLFIVYLLFRLF